MADPHSYPLPSTNPSSSPANTAMDDLAATQLPKPVTVVGSAFEPPAPPEPETPVEPETAPLTAQPQTPAVDDTTSVLPMPVVFGDEDEEEESTKPVMNPSATPSQTEVTEDEDELTFERQFPDSTTPATPPSPVLATPDLDGNPAVTPPPAPVIPMASSVPTYAQPPAPLTEPVALESTASPTWTAATPPLDPSSPNLAVSSSNTSLAPQTPQSQLASMEPPADDFHIPDLAPAAAQSVSQSPTPTTDSYPLPTPDVAVAPTPDMTSTLQPAPTGTDSVLYTPGTYASPITGDQLNPPTNQTVLPDDSADSPAKTNMFAKVALGMVAVLVGSSVVVGGYFASKQFLGKGETPQQAVVEKQPQIEKPAEVKPVQTPTPVPTTSPVPKADRSKAKVKVLNGSGEKGGASKAKALLEAAGFKEVATGNADNFDYTETEIQYKPDFAEYVELIIKDMGTTYKGVKGKELAKNEPFDIYVVLGNPNNATTAKSSPKPDLDETEDETTSPSPSASPRTSPSASPNASTSPTT